MFVMSSSGYDVIVYFTRISPYLTFVMWRRKNGYWAVFKSNRASSLTYDEEDHNSLKWKKFCDVPGSAIFKLIEINYDLLTAEEWEWLNFFLRSRIFSKFKMDCLKEALNIINYQPSNPEGVVWSIKNLS